MSDESYENEDDENEDERWTCQFPGRCCMPSPLHMADECYTPEMAEEQFREESRATRNQ